VHLGGWKRAWPRVGTARGRQELEFLSCAGADAFMYRAHGGSRRARVANETRRTALVHRGVRRTLGSRLRRTAIRRRIFYGFNGDATGWGVAEDSSGAVVGRSGVYRRSVRLRASVRSEVGVPTLRSWDRRLSYSLYTRPFFAYCYSISDGRFALR
jgi:hypothetical protein